MEKKCLRTVEIMCRLFPSKLYMPAVDCATKIVKERSFTCQFVPCGVIQSPYLLSLIPHLYPDTSSLFYFPGSFIK